MSASQLQLFTHTQSTAGGRSFMSSDGNVFVSVRAGSFIAYTWNGSEYVPKGDFVGTSFTTVDISADGNVIIAADQYVLS